MNATLSAADGYEIETSLSKLEGAIVALRDMEGRWLADTDANCPLRLVPPLLPGNFWVMNLCRVRVEPAVGGQE